MALPLGKLAILVGAGIVGSIIAKEENLLNISGFFSGPLKIALKQIRRDDSASSSRKPQDDTLLAQVNSLRQELQLLASSRPVTVVTSTAGSGTGRYGVIFIVVVLGYGYVWWKGWKLPDMMFATRRSLSDACASIAKQLENVYSSIAATKKHLSSRIERVDCSLDECSELTAATKEEVSELRGEMKSIGVDVQSVHHAVRTLETKINRIEGKQDFTYEGVSKLVHVVHALESGRTMEQIQGGPSRPALESPQLTAFSRTASLTPLPSLEPASPSASNGYHKVQQPLPSAVSASGLKELHAIQDATELSKSPEVSNGVHAAEDTGNGSTRSGLFGRKLPGIGASFLTRTRSAMQSFSSRP